MRRRRAEPTRRPVPAEVDLAVLSLAMHSTWEFVQAPWFSSMQAVGHLEGIALCLRAALGDVVIALVAFGAAALAGGGRGWVAAPGRAAVAVWFAAGLAITVAIEHYSTAIAGRWAYDPAMPLVPPFGTGLAPVLQWIVIPALVLWYLRRLHRAPGLA